MKTNCPNCGAVISPESNKCSYCGTPYFDMSAIDFEEGEPFYLKVKTKWNGQNVFITQLVKPSLKAINLTVESDEWRGGIGQQILCSCRSENRLTTEISFRGIPMEDNSLLKMEVMSE